MYTCILVLLGKTPADKPLLEYMSKKLNIRYYTMNRVDAWEPGELNEERGRLQLLLWRE